MKPEDVIYLDEDRVHPEAIRDMQAKGLYVVCVFGNPHECVKSGTADLRDILASACRVDLDVQFAAFWSSKWAAWICYKRADDMIRERNKE